ncbi:hypothetical protein SAMN02799625_05535 [Methylobacterium sp. UNC300MFChir4.1]|uniref:hypothetical protein n=1 Tax=Methylobacterium sp. UNC300MFChir4.1 TaxID=1502747 RepID=UPI0008B60994|nr:hypothetical protein [Methylobacterium sp. UNC300MFChir4.1]SEP33098.1 hypothetical protein SAMN02799625_05535 [Methylobacterium sp. UNC300MFChir4.1]
MPHVTFVHGILNKPPAEIELALWKSALCADDFPVDLDKNGVTCSSVYWADVLYGSPLEGVAPEDPTATTELRTLEGSKVTKSVGLEGRDPNEQRWVLALASKLGGRAAIPGDKDDQPPVEEADGSFERVPLPWTVKEIFLKNFLRDVHHYLFNETFSPRPGQIYAVQDEIRRRFVFDSQQVTSRPHVVVSHSMGTVIAYDCLKRVPEVSQADALITIGSPLGLDEIQDKLQPGWTRPDGFPDKVGGTWSNFFDHLDPVAAFDPFLSVDFRKNGQEVVKDIHEPNYGLWRHDLGNYLRGKMLRATLTQVLQI